MSSLSHYWMSEAELSSKLRATIEQMQSQIGKSGKTLHEIFSEYLSLKARDTTLASELENFEIPSIDHQTPEQISAQMCIIKKLQCLSKEMSPYGAHLQEHPWFGFAHADLNTTEMEHLQKSLRFSLIALNKFWVEFGSFPSLLSAMAQMSVRDAEKMCKWVQQPYEFIQLPQYAFLLSEMASMDVRQMVLECIRDIKCIRALQEDLMHNTQYAFTTHTSIELFTHKAQEASKIVAQYQLAQDTLHTLQDLRHKAAHNTQGLQEIQQFLQELHDATKIPIPQNPQELEILCLYLHQLSVLPRKILRWRIPSILGSQAFVRINAWKDRAKPLLEKRQRLSQHFILDADIDPKSLSTLTYHLTHGGPLKTFKTPFKKAKATYETLLVSTHLAAAESPYQMATWLNEWIIFLEESQAFAAHAEAQALFGNEFKGIDTDFDGALATHLWAQKTLQEASDNPINYSYTITQFIFQASLHSLAFFSTALIIKKLTLTEHLLKSTPLTPHSSLEQQLAYEQHRAGMLTQLHEAITFMEFHEHAPLSRIAEIRHTAEELSFLMQRLEKNEPFEKLMAGNYHGIHTNTDALEEVLRYLRYIEQAPIPTTLKETFLSSRGPQRFQENKQFILQALPSLKTVQEVFERLVLQTHGSFQQCSDFPIPYLLERMQNAIKNPHLLKGFVNYLQCENEIREQGLSSMLDYFQKQALPIEKFEIAYGLVVHGSLLKKAIQN